MALQRVRSNMLANNFVLDDDQGLIVGSGNNLYIDTANNRVGINTTSPNYALEVNGDLHATGNITAGGNITLGDSDADTITITAEIGSDVLPDIDNTYDLGSTAKKWAEVHATTFYGDGSQLTGIAATLDDILTNGNTSAQNIDLTGGTVTATSFIGDGSQLTGLASTLNDILTNGNTTALNIVSTGDITAANFIGDGSQLTGLASTLDEVTTNGATTTNSITVGGLTVNSTGAIELPVGTTAERPTAADGQIRFNSDLSAFEGYDGTEWGALGGGGAVYSNTAPTTNLKAGDLWFDTGTTGELYVYSGSEWLSTTGASGAAFYTRAFTGDNSTTAYTVGGSSNSALLVYVNGILLTSPADYSYAAGVVTFLTPPPLSSEIVILVYGQASGVSLALGDLTDVNLSVAPTDGQSVIWDNANSQWIAGDSFNQTDFDAAIALKSIGVLSDVDITSTPPTNEQVLVWDAVGGKFIPGDAAADFTDLTGSIALTQIPDALITPAKLQTGVTFVDEFTADGNTDTFTLTRDPGTGAAIQVFVDSVPQLVSNYTVSGTTLTLSGTPTNGQIVEVRGYGIASTVNVPADGSVTAAKLSNTVTTDDITEGSTNLYYTDARVQTKLGDVSGHIIPDTDIAYDLGSTNFKFRDLYLSGSSIQLGTRQITSDNIPEVDLSIAPEVLEIQVDAPAAGQDTAWLWTWATSSLPYARREITNSPELSVPLYKQGTYTVNNYAAYDLHDSMTQTHSLYLKWIDGAGTDNLVSWAVNSSSNPISDSHPDINGGTATDVQRINISVPSTVTPPTLTAPTVNYTVTNNGNGAYTFSGPASGDNPNIGPFYRGGTYTFDVTASGHPFYLTTDNGTNFSSGTYFGEYTNGVTNSRSDSGTVTFVVPSNAPDTLYYQCGNHGVMRGAITVKDLAVETNINGNYIVYFQHTQEGHKTPVEIRPIPSLVNQMCLVYDASVNKFVPQDLATYVENTPSFENKIREVAGTAELVVEDGSAVIAKVNVYDDSTYLPLVGNNPGDQAFATDTDILYIWDGSAWQQAGASNSDDLTEGTTNLFYTDARVGSYLTTQGYDTATNIIASITDSAPATLDTLNELAAALGDDPNFATTVTNQIATKANATDVYTQTQIDTALALKAPINNPTFTGTITGDGSGLTNVPSGLSRFSYTATSNQTTFAATYTTGNVDVFVNGIKLTRTTDYNDTSGTSIVLTTGCAAGELVEIIAYSTYTVPDAVSASSGGTFAGPVNFSSDIAVDTNVLKVDTVNNRIGVNTASPNYTMHLNETNGVLAFETPWSPGNMSQLRLGYVAGTQRSITGHYDNGMVIETNSHYLTLDGGGDLILGDVKGPVNYGNGKTLEIKSPSTQATLTLSTGNTDPRMYLFASTSEARVASYGSNELTMYVGSGHIAGFDSDGLKLQAGKGIKFSPHTSANILDNYEKGTWTGTLKMNSNYADTSGTNTNITATGNYILVGDLCQVDIYFDVQGYSNYVARFISGLPFTSVNSGQGQPLAMGHQRGIRFVYGGTIHSSMTTSAKVQPNNTQIELQAAYNGSAFSGWYYISNEPAQGKYIHVGGSYRIA